MKSGPPRLNRTRILQKSFCMHVQAPFGGHFAGFGAFWVETSHFDNVVDHTWRESLPLEGFFHPVLSSSHGEFPRRLFSWVCLRQQSTLEGFVPHLEGFVKILRGHPLVWITCLLMFIFLRSLLPCLVGPYMWSCGYIRSFNLLLIFSHVYSTFR